MEGRLIFVDGFALAVENIISFDFTNAKPETMEREVIIHLSNGKEIKVKSREGIEALVNLAVPQHLKSHYHNAISLVRN